MAGHLDEQALASLVTPHVAGLDALLRPERPGRRRPDPGDRGHRADRVAQAACYDFVIVDTPPAFTEHVLAAFDPVDVLVLLATLDIPAVKNLRLALDTLDLLGNPKDSRLIVLNRVRRQGRAWRPSDVERDHAGTRSPLTIPTSLSVPASVNRGVPIVLDEPSHPVSRGDACSSRTARRAHAESRLRRGARRPAAASAHVEPRRAASTRARRVRSRSSADRLDATQRADGARTARRGATAGTRSRGQGRVHQALIENLGPQLYDPHLAQAELEQQVRQTLQAVIEPRRRRSRRPTAPGSPRRSPTRSSATARSSRCCATRTSPRSWSTGRTRSSSSAPAGSTRSTRAFTDEAHLRRIIDKIVGRVGRRIDEASPMVDARLPDGSPRQRGRRRRSPSTARMLTIRKFAAGPVHRRRPDRLRHADPRRCATSSRPASGPARTSSSPAVPAPARRPRSTCCLGFIPDDERIVTIEDAAELQLHQEHVLRLESRPANIEGRGEITIRDLVRNSLRMRPDRIVVGEVRDGAALDMLQAMNTGHDGSITTVHANSPRDVARPAGDDGADGRRRPADARHPRAGRRARST